MNPFLPGFFLTLFLLFLGCAVRVLKEYERAVVFTLGRYSDVRGPGIITLIPFIQTLVRVDTRVRKTTVGEDIVSSDNQPFRLDADVYFQVMEADKAVNNVNDYVRATGELARTAMRETLRKRTYRETLDNLNGSAIEISKALNAQVAAWGITVTTVGLHQPGASVPANQPA